MSKVFSSAAGLPTAVGASAAVCAVNASESEGLPTFYQQNHTGLMALHNPFEQKKTNAKERPAQKNALMP